jgi:hypothetical protein
MFSGGIPQKHLLYWWLRSCPDSIQVYPYEEDERPCQPGLIASDQIGPVRLGSIKSGANPVARRASPDGPKMGQVELTGGLRESLAVLVGLKQLGLAR